MNTRTILIQLVFFCLGTVCFSQNIESIKADIFNKQYKLETTEDYSKHEAHVIFAHDWLLEHPIAQDSKQRKNLEQFLLKWLTGSPNITVEITKQIAPYIDCTDCLLMYMGGWASYALESKDYKNKFKGSLAGTESVIQFYQTNRQQLGKIKAIEKLITLQKKNKLEEYIKANL